MRGDERGRKGRKEVKETERKEGRKRDFWWIGGTGRRTEGGLLLVYN